LKVLVLNSGYEPIMVTDWTRAFSLVFCGKAIIVEEYDKTIRTVSEEFKVPAVISLKKYVRPRRIVNFSKRSIHIRDNFTCQYCGKRQGKSSLSLDHIIPKSKGGATDWKNMVSACIDCNTRKSDKLLKDTTFSLRRKPTQPLSIYNFLWEIELNEIPKEWKDYLTIKVYGTNHD